MHTVSSELHVLAHAETERRNFSTCGDGCICNLLDAMWVTCETRSDNAPAFVLGEDLAEHAADGRFARGKAEACVLVESASSKRIPSER